MRKIPSLILIGVFCVGCSDGVSLQNSDELGSHLSEEFIVDELNNVSVQSYGAASVAEAALVVNDPGNTVDEPTARAWLASKRKRQAQCSADLIQSVSQAFATRSFQRVHDEYGEYIVSTQAANTITAEYIEFCVTTSELARFRIKTRVQANHIHEDSFFVTINEDQPDTVINPEIYDVSRSAHFKDDFVRTRTSSPLVVTLPAGEQLIRFYFREPNTSIRSIALELDNTGGPILDFNEQAISPLAQCAKNTGLTEVEISNLITQYLGNVDRRFVLAPLERNRGYTIRDDYSWTTNSGRGNIMCMSLPPEGGFNLIENTVTENQIVIGSQGPDATNRSTQLKGTFIGNGGMNRIEAINGGTFIGGDGRDWVNVMISGVYQGGSENDALVIQKGGEFLGNAGEDSVLTQFSGLFDGDSGNDTVTRLSTDAVINNVENEGVLFDMLPPPTDLRFTASTVTSTVASWQAPVSIQVDGYTINTPFLSAMNSLAYERGVIPVGVPGIDTVATETVLENLFERPALIQVRAFKKLEDGSYLYSEPLSESFDGLENPGAEELLASVDIRDDFAIDTVSLASDSSVVATRFRAPSITSTAPIVRFDSMLNNQTSVFNDVLSDSVFRITAGKDRLYGVTRGNEDNPSTVVAFNGNASSVVWQQRLFPEGAGSVSGTGIGCRPVVTQDDWLHCMMGDGSVIAFDTNGNRFSQEPQKYSLERLTLLVDGAGSLLVQVVNEREFVSDFNPKYPVYTTLDLSSGEQQKIRLDNLPGLSGKVVKAEAMAVDGAHLLVIGQFQDTCSEGQNCASSAQLEPGSFFAKVLIADGSMVSIKTGELSDRLGTGVGTVLEGSVFFSTDGEYTRSNVNSLELKARAPTPGRALAFRNDTVLALENIGYPLVEGYRINLLRMQ